VTAQTASAALAFSDVDAAKELLGAFKALPTLQYAGLYSSSGKILAEYLRDERSNRARVEGPEADLSAQGAEEVVRVHPDHIHIRNPVTQAGEPIGILVVEADTKRMLILVQETGQTAGLVFVMGSLIAYFLGALLSARLARPIKELASSMEDISRSKDYSKRLVPLQQDEIGQLFVQFNGMVEQIERRDAALLENQQTLEDRVAARTEDLVRERQQLLGIIENAPVAIAMFDNEFRYVAHSQKWLQDYGLTGKLIGRSHYEVFPDIPDRWREIHRRALAGERAQASEDVFERADGGKIFMRWALQPWFQADGVQGGVLMVTDRIDDLVAAREAALQTAKIRSEFLTNMSHELRTPLNGILGFTELLIDESGLSASSREHVEAIFGSGKILLALINDILDFSKLEQKKLGLEVTTFRLGEVLHAAARIFTGQAERKSLTLEVADSFSEMSVRGDSLRLQQVLINLIGNAIKFTSHGSIQISIKSLVSCDRELEATFSVKDTGLGIPLDKQESIFEAFAQADGSTTRKYGGTGLGLAICVQLVRLMGGRIWVKSSPGSGSEFLFTVKLLESEHSLMLGAGKPGIAKDFSQEPLAAQDANVRQRPRILVAEDNVMNQRLVSAILERAGYQVKVVENGSLAVEAAKGSEFAAILMDLQMPVMNGLEAIELIRKQEVWGSSRVPILALTAHAFAEHREQCLSVGVDDYLTKPINRELLLTTLKRFIDASQNPH
jgi:PAS domain S-box-containing protein